MWALSIPGTCLAVYTAAGTSAVLRLYVTAAFLSVFMYSSSQLSQLLSQ